MGKTLPPFSQLIEYERRRWAPLKRALPKADQAIFDRLFDCAKLHIGPIGGKLRRDLIDALFRFK